MRRVRPVLAVLAAVAATGLAAADNRPGWTALVGVVTGSLALAVVVADRRAGARSRAARAAEKRQAEVDAILWRYERQRAERERDEGRR